MTHMEYVSPPPCCSASTGISESSLEGPSKGSYEGALSPPFSGSRYVKSRNESMARNTARRESKSKGHLVRRTSLRELSGGIYASRETMVAIP